MTQGNDRKRKKGWGGTLREPQTVAGLSLICGVLTGIGALLLTVYLCTTEELLAAGVSLIAAALAFGLTANALLRQ